MVNSWSVRSYRIDYDRFDEVCLCLYMLTILNIPRSIQESEELSSEEDEMKIAEMRPPLIEISINQPKVVALGKDKKGKPSEQITLTSVKSACSFILIRIECRRLFSAELLFLVGGDYCTSAH